MYNNGPSHEGISMSSVIFMPPSSAGTSSMFFIYCVLVVHHLMRNALICFALAVPERLIKVPLRGPSKAWAEKISLADPPPPDAEAYFAPKRTVKHFTDEYFEWKARLISHGDLDERGKNKV